MTSARFWSRAFVCAVENKALGLHGAVRLKTSCPQDTELFRCLLSAAAPLPLGRPESTAADAWTSEDNARPSGVEGHAHLAELIAALLRCDRTGCVPPNWCPCP